VSPTRYYKFTNAAANKVEDSLNSGTADFSFTLGMYFIMFYIISRQFLEKN